MTIILANIEVLPEKRMEFSQTLLPLVQDIKNESGCLNASFYQSFGHEDRFLLVTEWSTKNDVAAYLASEAFLVFKGTTGLMPRKPEIMIYSVEKSELLKL